MGQFSKVLLAIDNEYKVPQGPGLQTRLRWVKPYLWAQEYLCQVYEPIYQMYKYKLA